MKVIVYKSKHGTTKKVAKIISEYIDDCLLMDLVDLDYRILEKADMIIVGTPVYHRELDSGIVEFVKNNQELLLELVVFYITLIYR